MPSQPATVDDKVLYTLNNIYVDKNITVRLLDGSILDIWGPVYVNGDALVNVGALPIATQAEAEAGVDNTKVMTPLRVSQAIDVQAVTSVNGETGIVVLNQDEVLDGTIYKQYSQTEKTKLAGIATGATVGPTQEQIEDFVAAQFAAGTHTNATVTYNDTTGSLSIAASGGGGGSVSDAVYAAGWNGDTTNAPSKNAVYDKVEALDGLVVHKAGSETINGDKTFSGSTVFSGFATMDFVIINTFLMSSGPITVPDAAYGPSWNGSEEVPTKNALYDKIETLGAGGGVSDVVWVGNSAPVNPDIELWYDTDEVTVSGGSSGPVPADHLYLLRTTV